MSKPTQGPWVVVTGEVQTPEGISIAIMDREERRTRPVERDANARLCAAAPELLGALLGGMKEMSITGWHRRDCPTMEDMDNACSPLCGRARSAIAKALGEVEG